MVGGVAVVGDNKDLADQLKFLQNAIGAISGPFDSFLALRGLKTLALRMERHSANGLKIAQWLESAPDVRRVIYPGLASHPQHAIAKRQMHAFGGMIIGRCSTATSPAPNASSNARNCSRWPKASAASKA